MLIFILLIFFEAAIASGSLFDTALKTNNFLY